MSSARLSYQLTELDYLIVYWLDFFSLRPHLLIGWIVSLLLAQLFSLLVGKSPFLFNGAGSF
jgi:hypothetical protein